MSDLTIAQFDSLIGDAYSVAADIEKLEAELLEPKRARLKELEGKILAQLEAQELSSYKCKHGQVIRTKRFTVATPKSIEEKVAFFDWLATKGDEVRWQYTTVNSQSLNSLYKAEMEVAKEEGNFEFKIPGIGEPTFVATLSRRKG